MDYDVLKSKKLIIFDLDGTLIDSLDTWNKVDATLVKVIRGDGKTTEQEMQPLRDEALRLFSHSPNPYVDYCGYLKEKFRSDYSQEEIYKLRYQIASELVEKEVHYKPFVPEFLKKMKSEGKVLAIASAAQRKNVEIYRHINKDILSTAKMDDYFSLILARNDCVEIKPNPEIFLKVFESFPYKKEEAIIFEDSLVGLQAAKRAGVECAIVYDKHSDYERDEINALADYTIASFEELL